jgi:predicted dehydrogenase
MRVGIIGCGFIGHKRAATLCGCMLAVCCDVCESRAEALARGYPGSRVSSQWREVIHADDVDLLIVSTRHDTLAEICYEAACAGKHVLLEKPGARRACELDPVLEACRRTGALVRIGFNHRYHRAFRRAQEILRDGALGDLMFVRGRYGHGGRPGYEKEWRADPERSGGGELIDQGVHLIDLARWFLGDFTRVQAHIATYYWNVPVEDNGFLLLTTRDGKAAFLHASWTEWKNLFSFEIYGRVAKLSIDGLGASYGVERLTWYQMTPEMGPPMTSIWEYPMPDDSWDVEFASFLEDIRARRAPVPGILDAQAALRIVEHAYKESSR